MGRGKRGGIGRRAGKQAASVEHGRVAEASTVPAANEESSEFWCPKGMQGGRVRQLFSVTGRLNGHECRILVDCGATCSFLSEDCTEVGSAD